MMMPLSVETRFSLVRSQIGPMLSCKRRILDREAFDAAVGPAGLLRGAVHQVVVVLVGERPVGAGHVFAVHALAGLHRRALLALVSARVGWKS